MQLATKHNTVETGSVIKTGAFGIAKNAKMFHILSDSMYKDKIGSMVRELSSNARDAHVDAGIPEQPFFIHLPNAFEPWFSVTDHGTGISADDVFNVLCVYGESTKDQSNDAIGAFGLGAKTPFAYTDNFTVISRFDGIERLYTACIGEDGLPTLNLQVEMKTEIYDGFQITVSVNEGDFDRFKEKTAEQLKFFPIKPTIENCKDFEWDDLDEGITYDSDLVKMYNGSYSNPISGLWVTQGGVSYPVDIDELQDIDSHTKAFANALAEKNAVMPFEIGQIDVTAPRESISYDKRTITSVIDRVALVAKTMCRDVVAEVQKEKSIWNRAVIYNTQIGVVQTAIRQSPLFDNLFKGMDKDRHGKLAVNMDDLVALDCRAVNMIKFNSYRSNSAGTTVKRKELGNSSHYGDEYLTAAQKINVYIRDTNSKPMARIKHFVFENDFPLTVMIEGKTELLDDSHKVAVAAALRMPVDSIKLLSELEAPKNVTLSPGRGYTAPKAYQWNFNKLSTCSRDWIRLYDDISDIGAAVWIEMDRHDIRWSEDAALMFTAAEGGQLGYDVIAVNGRTARRIEAGKIGEDLITVCEAAKEVRGRVKDKTSLFIKYTRNHSFVQELNNNSVVRTLVEKGLFPELAKQIDNISAKNKLMGTSLEDHKWIRRHLHGLSEASERGIKRAKSIKAGIIAQFPMLKYVASRHGALLADDVLADVMLYIEQKNKVELDNSA